MKRFLAVVAVAGLVAALVGSAQATVLVDRGLPGENLNATDATRSNVTWASGQATGFTGDDFTIGAVGQQYRIDSITVWGAQYNPLSLDINNIWLYLGKDGSPLTLRSSGAVIDGTNTNSNPNITHTFVTYPDAAHTAVYVGNGGLPYFLAETTFSNLNLLVDGGVKYNFGVRGDNYLWWNHASNAALSGTQQDGADNLYLEFDAANLGAAPIVWDSNGTGWDKSSDINVLVEGEMVPEPTTLVIWSLLGLAGAGFGFWRRKK